jgi:hypothetical protein
MVDVPAGGESGLVEQQLDPELVLGQSQRFRVRAGKGEAQLSRRLATSHSLCLSPAGISTRV